MSANMNFIEKQLVPVLTQNWWVLLLRGVVAIGFGVLTWITPQMTLAAMMLFFGIYTLVDGVIGIWISIKGRKEHEYWWAWLLWALASVGMGIVTFMAPGATAIAILFYIAIWAITTGILQIITAIRLRKEMKGEWLLILIGLLSVVFGVLLIMQPGAGVLAVLWMIGSYAVMFGILFVFFAFRMRSLGRQASLI